MSKFYLDSITYCLDHRKCPKADWSSVHCALCRVTPDSLYLGAMHWGFPARWTHYLPRARYHVSSNTLIWKLKCKQIQVNKMMSCNSSQVIIAAHNWHTCVEIVGTKNKILENDENEFTLWIKTNKHWKYRALHIYNFGSTTSTYLRHTIFYLR